MKKIKLAKLIIQINLLFFVVYNAYFGFNSQPLTEIEENCDIIFSSITKIGILIYILPLFTLYESAVESKDNKTVLTGDNVVDESP
jgi:uncharacterized protein YbbC (DUF1343 family)